MITVTMTLAMVVAVKGEVKVVQRGVTELVLRQMLRHTLILPLPSAILAGKKYDLVIIIRLFYILEFNIEKKKIENGKKGWLCRVPVSSLTLDARRCAIRQALFNICFSVR